MSQTTVRSSTLTPTVASAGNAHFNTGTYEEQADVVESGDSDREHAPDYPALP